MGRQHGLNHHVSLINPWVFSQLVCRQFSGTVPLLTAVFACAPGLISHWGCGTCGGRLPPGPAPGGTPTCDSGSSCLGPSQRNNSHPGQPCSLSTFPPEPFRTPLCWPSSDLGLQCPKVFRDTFSHTHLAGGELGPQARGGRPQAWETPLGWGPAGRALAFDGNACRPWALPKASLMFSCEWPQPPAEPTPYY